MLAVEDHHLRLAVVFRKIFLMIHALVVRTEQAPHKHFLIGGDALEKLLFNVAKLVDHRAIHLKLLRAVLAFVEKFAVSHAAERQVFRHRERGIDQYAGNAAQLFAVESAHRSGDDQIGGFVGHQLPEKRHRLGRHHGNVGRDDRHSVGIKLFAQHNRCAIVAARSETVEKEYFFHREEQTISDKKK